MRVKEVMNDAVGVDHDISLKAAAKIMSDKNIGSLVVVKGSKVIGIVTERDVMKNLSNLSRKILSIVAKQVITIEQNDDIDDAALLMAQHKIRRLPVLDKQGNLVGIVTSTDLIAHSDDLNEDFLFE